MDESTLRPETWWLEGDSEGRTYHIVASSRVAPDSVGFVGYARSGDRRWKWFHIDAPGGELLAATYRYDDERTVGDRLPPGMIDAVLEYRVARKRRRAEGIASVLAGRIPAAFTGSSTTQPSPQDVLRRTPRPRAVPKRSGMPVRSLTTLFAILFGILGSASDPMRSYGWLAWCTAGLLLFVALRAPASASVTR